MNCFDDGGPKGQNPRMADGGMVVELDQALAERLKTAAASAGKSALDYAVSLIADGLDADWAEDDRRFAEFERTGVSENAEDALLRMRESLKTRFQAKV